MEVSQQSPDQSLFSSICVSHVHLTCCQQPGPSMLALSDFQWGSSNSKMCIKRERNFLQTGL